MASFLKSVKGKPGFGCLNTDYDGGVTKARCAEVLQKRWREKYGCVTFCQGDKDNVVDHKVGEKIVSTGGKSAYTCTIYSAKHYKSDKGCGRGRFKDIGIVSRACHICPF